MKKGIQLPLIGSELWGQLHTTCPLLCSLLLDPGRGLISLKVVYRGETDFLAVLKVYAGDGTVNVCFGSGVDYVGSLIGLERAIDQDKFRPDKWLNRPSK